MDSNQLMQLYIQEMIEEQAKQKRQNLLGNTKSYAKKIKNYGKGFSSIGDSIKNNINNEVAQKLGATMSNIGGTLQNGANTVTGALNKPVNYFKGFAGNGLQNIGANLAANEGLAGTLGGGISKVGAALAGETAASTGAAGAGMAAGAGATAGGTGAAGAGAAGGPIGALLALGAMALTGAHRHAAKKSGRKLRHQTTQMAEQGNADSDQQLAQIQQNTAALQEQAQQNLNNGFIKTQDVDGNMVNFPTTKEAFALALKNNGWDNYGVNSALNGLNRGNKEMSDYINYYNTVAQDGQQIAIPKTEEEIARARALVDGQVVDSQPVSEENQAEQVKQGLLNKFISGISDLSKGYEENRNTAFSPSNLEAANKSKMTRIGEAAGTLGRMVQKPGVQALIAGGLSTALTGNPLYGIGMATKYGGQRAMNNIYQKALEEQGVNIDPGMFGSLSSSDMNALMSPRYKAIEQQVANEKLQELIRHNQEMEDHYRTMDAIRQQDANTKEYRVKNGTTVTHVSSGKSGSSGKSTKVSGKSNTTQKGGKEATVKMQAPNGKIYYVPESQIQRYKKAGGKIIG